MEDDPYKTLGLKPDADPKQVRSAHRLLARRYHPDAGPSASNEKFRAVQHAYDILSDPGRRASYDRARRAPERRPIWRPAAAGRGPLEYAEHLDLRSLSRRSPPETIDLRHSRRTSQPNADPWETLLDHLFGDQR